MNDEYDIIVLGTGLKECLISGLLSKIAKISEKNEQKFFSLIEMGIMAQSQPPWILPTYGRRSEAEQNPQKNMEKTETGMLILFLNLLWQMEI